jgi:6-phosphogluconolactonase (cycloisomerase 2 family)
MMSSGARGRLTLIEHTTRKIAFPRHFNIDPTGRWLYACNQKGDTIVPFAIDQSSGRLTETGLVTRVPVPVTPAFKNL